MKYSIVVAKITQPMKIALEEVPRRSGMYNWMFLFKGQINNFNDCMEELENYDVIQVNMSPVDQSIIPEIHERLKNSSTKLVLNNDYVCEDWGRWHMPTLQYERIQKMGDMVYGTEPRQTSHMIEGSFCMPHPTWVSMLSKVGIDNDWPDDHKILSSLFHWWEGRSFNQSLLFERLRRYLVKKKFTVHTKTLGYSPEHDVSKKWRKLMFDAQIGLMDYPEFLEHLGRSDLVLEQSAYHTYGRTSVDTACIGIPTIGTNRVFSMRHCWPNMICDPFDLRTQEKIAKKVIEDPGWTQEQLKLARKKVEYFNYKNSKKRYLRALEIASESRSPPKKGYYTWNEEYGGYDE